MTPEQMAKSKAEAMGFDAVKRVGTWKGLQAFYYFNSKDPENADIGLPSYILTDGMRLRVTDADEAFEIIKALFPE